MYLSDADGEFKSDNDGGVWLVVKYEVDSDNGKNVDKIIKDEVNEKIYGSVD